LSNDAGVEHKLMFSWLCLTGNCQWPSALKESDSRSLDWNCTHRSRLWYEPVEFSIPKPWGFVCYLYWLPPSISQHSLTASPSVRSFVWFIPYIPDIPPPPVHYLPHSSLFIHFSLSLFLFLFLFSKEKEKEKKKKKKRGWYWKRGFASVSLVAQLSRTVYCWAAGARGGELE
jgi:hypothetical protein